jgi:DNA-binding SARP family transcriptional activator
MQTGENRSATPTLYIHLLGDFRLAYDGEPVTTVNTARLQSLLAYLLLHREAPQSRQHLAFLLWPDSTERQARTNLRKQVHNLRRALPDPDRFLRADAKTLQWLPDAPFTLDVAGFESALAQAEHAGDVAATQGLLEQAVGSYRGDLLSSCYDDWIIPERERLRQRFSQALDRLVQSLENQRAYPVAIRHAQRLLRHDPLHEATYRRLMRLHALNGDRAGALRAYHACATVLGQELGVEPSAATQEAYERLLQRDGSPTAAPSSGKATTPLPLVGRNEEWGQLQEAWHKTRSGKPQLALVTGEAGIGKTRLAEELLSWSGRQGIASASARCYASGGELAYAPVTAWLRTDALQRGLASMEPAWLTEVARLLPELLAERPDLPLPGPLTEPWQRQRLFEALARPFLAQRQLVLLIDDLQWCDQETLEWLSFLLRTEPSGRLLVLGTLRMEEVPDDPWFATLLRDLRRDRQLTEIGLGPLDESEAATLAGSVKGRELETILAAALYRETEGNPLFVVETVRAGLPGRDTATKRRWPVPRTVQEVIAGRLDQLSAQARELAGVAATIGREFTLDVLAQASGADEEGLVRGLDELWGRRVVREQGAAGYDFSHDKIREVAYGGLSAVRRRWLHRRVAEALERVHASNLDDVCGKIATHYEAAGQAGQAISYYQIAATVARRFYANQEAIDHLLRARALLSQSSEDDPLAAQVHEQLGDIRALVGQYEEARKAYESAFAEGPEAERLWCVQLRRKIANTWRSQQRYDEAHAAYDQAIRMLGPAPEPSNIDWWQVWLDIQLDLVDLLYFQLRLTELAELCEKLRPYIAAYGSPKQQANYYSALGMLHHRQSRFKMSAKTVVQARTALEWAQKTDDRQLIDHKMFSVGFALLWHGDLEAATEQLTVALSSAEQTGNLPLQDRCLAYLTISCRMQGDLNQARAYAQQGLEAATAEQSPYYIGVARANLAWLDYRAGRMTAALDNGRAALEQWQSFDYPFHWLAHWPLLAIQLSQDNVAEAVDHARAMLDPVQQRLPDLLTAHLERAIQAWQDDHTGAAHQRLEQALELAQELGYL